MIKKRHYVTALTNLKRQTGKLQIEEIGGGLETRLMIKGSSYVTGKL